MIKKYYVVYIIGVKLHKGIFECADEIKENNLDTCISEIKYQILRLNVNANEPSDIGIISWQEL